MHMQAGVVGLLGAAKLASAIYIPFHKISSEAEEVPSISTVLGQHPAYDVYKAPLWQNPPAPVEEADFHTLVPEKVVPPATEVAPPHVTVAPPAPVHPPVVHPPPPAVDTAVPPAVHTVAPGGVGGNTACADISKMVADFLAQFDAQAALNQTVEAPTELPDGIDPQLALDCLTSMPLDAELTLEYIKRVSVYLQFQSTVVDLKHPPAGSLQDPVDIIGTLEMMAAQVKNGEFKNHLEFETAFTKLMLACHDGHLFWGWNSRDLIAFRGPFALASLSVDGIQKPKVYVERDLVNPALGFNKSSPITAIDGIEVESYLAAFADFGFSQSPDARYNDVFANRDPGSPGQFFLLPPFYPGKNNLTVTYANASTIEYSYQAFVAWTPTINWTSIDSGETFYQTAVLNPFFFQDPNAPIQPPANMTIPPNSTATEVPEEQGPIETPELVLFNQPFMQHKAPAFVQDLNAIMGGYFLNDSLGTAVIDLSSFSAADRNAQFQFEGVQAAVSEFLAECTRRHSKRLIVDVRGNGGGLIDMSFDFYKQLFPAAKASSTYRIRAHEGAQIYAEAFETIASDQAVAELEAIVQQNGFNDLAPEQNDLIGVFFSGYNRQGVVDLQGNTPKDLASYMGPFKVNGDDTSLVVENVLDTVFGAPISGFGPLKNFTETPQPFLNENMIILSDGICASACTIFGEMVKKEQKGISTIVMGGRPNHAPSPHIGGTHGYRVLQFSELLANADFAVTLLPPQNEAEVERYVKNLPDVLPFSNAGAAINFRDAIRPEDPTQTPLQFVLEPADCRLFFSPQTFEDSILLWEQTAQLKWGAQSIYPGCAVGGLGEGEASVGAIPDDPVVAEGVLGGFPF